MVGLLGFRVVSAGLGMGACTSCGLLKGGLLSSWHRMGGHENCELEIDKRRTVKNFSLALCTFLNLGFMSPLQLFYNGCLASSSFEVRTRCKPEESSSTD